MLPAPHAMATLGVTLALPTSVRPPRAPLISSGRYPQEDPPAAAPPPLWQRPPAPPQANLSGTPLSALTPPTCRLCSKGSCSRLSPPPPPTAPPLRRPPPAGGPLPCPPAGGAAPPTYSPPHSPPALGLAARRTPSPPSPHQCRRLPAHRQMVAWRRPLPTPGSEPPVLPGLTSSPLPPQSTGRIPTALLCPPFTLARPPAEFLTASRPRPSPHPPAHGAHLPPPEKPLLAGPRRVASPPLSMPPTPHRAVGGAAAPRPAALWWPPTPCGQFPAHLLPSAPPSLAA